MQKNVGKRLGCVKVKNTDWEKLVLINSIFFAEPRRRGGNQTPPFLQRRQVEGPGGAKDQTAL